jgi:aldose 1-epimerase
MFELAKTPFGKYTRYDLFSPVSGHRFSIVPAAGANLIDLQFKGNSVLDGYQTPEELEAGKWGKSSLLFPFPNRLDGGKYTWNGKTRQFPINNAATGNAIHGFVRDEAFEVEYVFLARTCASIRCFYDYPGDRDYYPFPFSMEVEFTLHDSGKFEFRVEVQNLHDETMPLGFGWHPYFKLAGHVEEHALQLPACEKVAINDRLIPTGGRSQYRDFATLTNLEDTQLDTCFQATSSFNNYRLTLSGAGRQLQINAPIKQFPFFQVFTPPHRESIALEPMSCNVDAFNNGQGLVALAPNKKWSAKMNIQYH